MLQHTPYAGLSQYHMFVFRIIQCSCLMGTFHFALSLCRCVLSYPSIDALLNTSLHTAPLYYDHISIHLGNNTNEH